MLSNCCRIFCWYRGFRHRSESALLFLKTVAESEKVGPFNLKLTTYVGRIVAPTDRSTLIRNRRIIEQFCSVFVLL